MSLRSNKKFYVIAELPEYLSYLRGNDETRIEAKLRPPSEKTMFFHPMSHP